MSVVAASQRHKVDSFLSPRRLGGLVPVIRFEHPVTELPVSTFAQGFQNHRIATLPMVKKSNKTSAPARAQASTSIGTTSTTVAAVQSFPSVSPKDYLECRTLLEDQIFLIDVSLSCCVYMKLISLSVLLPISELLFCGGMQSIRTVHRGPSSGADSSKEERRSRQS